MRTVLKFTFDRLAWNVSEQDVVMQPVVSDQRHQPVQVNQHKLSISFKGFFNVAAGGRCDGCTRTEMSVLGLQTPLTKKVRLLSELSSTVAEPPTFLIASLVNCSCNVHVPSPMAATASPQVKSMLPTSFKVPDAGRRADRCVNHGDRFELRVNARLDREGTRQGSRHRSSVLDR